MNSLLLFLLIVLGRGEGKQQSNTSEKGTSNILSLKKHPQRSLQKTFIRPFCSLTTIFYNSAKNYETEKHLQLFESSFNDAKSLLKHTIIQFDLQAFYQIYHYQKKKKIPYFSIHENPLPEFQLICSIRSSKLFVKTIFQSRLKTSINDFNALTTHTIKSNCIP